MDIREHYRQRIERLETDIAQNNEEVLRAGPLEVRSTLIATVDESLKTASELICDAVYRELVRKLEFGIHTLSQSKKIVYALRRDTKCRAVFCYGNPRENMQTVKEWRKETGSVNTFAINNLGLPTVPNDVLLVVDFKQELCAQIASIRGVRVCRMVVQDDKEKSVDVSPIMRKALAKAYQTIEPTLKRYGAYMEALQSHTARMATAAKLHKELENARRAADTWSGIYLSEAVLKEAVSLSEEFTTSESVTGGLLLKGTPGTGKTLLAKTIGSAAGARFIEANIGRLKQGYLGHAAQAVSDLWKEARNARPCILFIDECDALFPRRGSLNSDVMASEVTNAFLSEWTGKDAGIWVIGATNRRDLLDDAILSRFATELELGQPDASARVQIFGQELSSLGWKEALPANLDQLTQGMSGRDLAMLAQRYVRRAKVAIVDFPALVGEHRGMSNPSVDPHATWETLVLDDETHQKLMATCAMLKDSEGWKKRGVSVPTGILLQGPPGTGKTQIARTIANEGAMSFLKASVADIKGMYLGQSAEKVKGLFEKARAAAPAILFIDEIDVVAPRRSRSEDSFTGELVSQLLQEMDGVVKHTSNVFVLAATNLPEAIDPAILSRLSEVITIPLPDLAGRTRLLHNALAAAKCTAVGDGDCSYLANLAQGLSGRDINSWIGLAQRNGVMRAMKHGGASSYELLLSDLVDTLPQQVASTVQQ